MTRSCAPLLLAALALAAVAAAAPAQNAAAATGAPLRLALVQAADDGVLDDAQMFSPETVKAARARIRQIRKEYHCAVLIDTVSLAPASDRSKANSWSAHTANAYFHDWATRRAREFGVEGIHVLICKQPRKVVVVAWPERFETEFNAKERSSIERLLTQRLVASPDDALLAALDSIREHLQAHTEPAPPSVPLGPLGMFIACTVGVWLLLSAVRMRLHKPEPFSFTAGPQSLRLTAGLLASMFGNPCGYWITDRLFPHGRTDSSAEIVLGDTPPVKTPTPTEEVLQTDETGAMPEHAEMKQE
jgi:hypothetical protein